MITNNSKVVIAAITGILVVLIFLYINQETFSNIAMTSLMSHLPTKHHLDSISANNVLTFTENKECDGKSITNNHDQYNQEKKTVSWDINKDCALNPQYSRSMCLQRRQSNKDLLCSSVVGIVPRPQNSNEPKKFNDF